MVPIPCIGKRRTVFINQNRILRDDGQSENRGMWVWRGAGASHFNAVTTGVPGQFFNARQPECEGQVSVSPVLEPYKDRLCQHCAPARRLKLQSTQGE